MPLGPVSNSPCGNFHPTGGERLELLLERANVPAHPSPALKAQIAHESGEAGGGLDGGGIVAEGLGPLAAGDAFQVDAVLGREFLQGFLEHDIAGQHPLVGGHVLLDTALVLLFVLEHIRAHLQDIETGLGLVESRGGGEVESAENDADEQRAEENPTSDPHDLQEPRDGGQRCRSRLAGGVDRQHASLKGREVGRVANQTRAFEYRILIRIKDNAGFCRAL